MQPNSFVRLFCSLLLFLLLATFAFAQTRPAELQRDTRPRNCSLYGRVTINGQPAGNVPISVIEIPTNLESPQTLRQQADGSISRSSFKTRTDAEGRYQMINLPPGRYMIVSASKAFVATDASNKNYEPTLVTMDAGESRENVDFSLVRGGVITGQITDSEGRPIIAQSVRVLQVTAGPDGRSRFQNRGGELGERSTDDRGVYRIYGLPAGRYVLSAGGEDDFFSSTKYPQTFYPDATDENQARIIEVSAGKEITDINIRLGVTRKRYEAIGHVVEADTGKPIPNLHISANKVYSNQENNDEDRGGGSSYSQADRLGNFRLTGLSRGKYKAGIYAGWMESSEFYAEPMTFELVDGNISGVEIKAARGGTLSGISVVEGSNDPAVKSLFGQVQIYAHTEINDALGESDLPRSHHQLPLKPDGSFLIAGVAPGKLRIGVHAPRGLTLARIERGGAEIKEFIELTKGEKVTDLRLVFSSGTGVIRGQVQIVGGQPLGGVSNFIEASIVGNTASRGFSAQLDDKGRFELTNLPSGEYELRLNNFSRTNGDNYQMRTLIRQRVNVASGSEARVTLTYDPSRKDPEER